jgi:hypothetical protein
MNKEFIPYEQALELKELGFNEQCIGEYYLPFSQHLVGIKITNIKDNGSPLYQQAFRWLREKYEFTYSIGKTNIAVVHYGTTTQLLQNNDSYEAAELATIKYFIESHQNK